jgi:type II secretory pathway component PulJ
MKRPSAPAASRGLSLAELLVATAITGVVLAGAWAWLWSVAPPARSLGANAQASSAAAFALRTVTRDLQEGAELFVPTACAPDCGLLLEHRGPATAPETVAIVWDPSRQVLWRKTSSTYLADHVTRFAVAYLSSAGDALEVGTAGGRLSGVGVVRVAVTVEVGGREATRSVDVAVRLQ